MSARDTIIITICTKSFNPRSVVIHLAKIHHKSSRLLHLQFSPQEWEWVCFSDPINSINDNVFPFSFGYQKKITIKVAVACNLNLFFLYPSFNSFYFLWPLAFTNIIPFCIASATCQALGQHALQEVPRRLMPGSCSGLIKVRRL